MAKSILGRAEIRVDGSILPTADTATLNPGGVTREAKMGAGQVYGFSEEDVPPRLEVPVHLTADVDPLALRDLTNATVIFRPLAEGHRAYMLREAWVAEVPEVSAGDGTITLVMSAVAVEYL